MRVRRNSFPPYGYSEGIERMYGLFRDMPPLAEFQSARRIAWRPAVNGKNSNTVAYSVFLWQKPFAGPLWDVASRKIWFDYKDGCTLLDRGRLFRFNESGRFFEYYTPGEDV